MGRVCDGRDAGRPRRVLWLSPECLLVLLGQPRERLLRLVGEALPRDVTLVRGVVDFDRGQWGLVLESLAWAPVGFGEALPVQATPAVQPYSAVLAEEVGREGA